MKRGFCCAVRVIHLAEWLYEAGIGEERAILVQNGRIVEARIERPGGAKAGLVCQAKLVKQLPGRRRAIVTLSSGDEALLSPVPTDITEGMSLIVEVVREAVHESHRDKFPLVKAAPDKAPANEPSLLDEISNGDNSVRQCHAHDADHFAESGWHELIEEARSGLVNFDGGTLEIAVTSAMTLIDVDGEGDARTLARLAAKEAAFAIRRLGLQGSIGVDFPNLPDKVDRQKIGELVDEHMIGAFERTAINGFGFMQIVRKRVRASLPELLKGRLITGHMIDLLRRAERDKLAGAQVLVAHPAVIAKLSRNPDLTAELSRRTAREVSLRTDPKLAISGHYVEQG